MASSRFRELLRSDADGTLAGDEAAQLHTLLAAHAEKNFETCPVCRGAFTIPFPPAKQVECPQCGTRLECYSTDVAGHQRHEIDPEVPFEQWLGVFSVGYTAPGTQPCPACGMIYPRNYSCCPGLLVLAVEWQASNPRGRAALKFLEQHAETLLNALRGGFGECFEGQLFQTLEEMADALSCGGELRDILALKRLTPT